MRKNRVGEYAIFSNDQHKFQMIGCYARKSIRRIFLKLFPTVFVAWIQVKVCHKVNGNMTVLLGSILCHY